MTLSTQTVQQINKLRQAGHSLKEISRQLNIAKSTVSLYSQNIKLNNQAKKRIAQIRKDSGFQPGNSVNPRSITWTSEKVNEVKKLYESGLSMREVGEKMNLGIWSICRLMRKRKLLRRTENETRYLQFINSPLSFKPKTDLTEEELRLKIAGLMLYCGEGGKKNVSGIDFANSDPQMITLFLKFFRTIYQPSEHRLRVYLYSYITLPTDELIKYWSDLTQIPTSHFTKPYVRRKSNLKHDKMLHGLIHIRYHDKRLLELVLSDLEKLKSWGTEAVNRACL